MPDGRLRSRRALPAAPIALLAGFFAPLPWLDGGTPAWIPAVAGASTLIAVFTGTYVVMGAVSERARRITGYLATVALAVVVGGLLALLALAAALCGWSAERCDDDTLVWTLTVGALAAPVALIVLYATIDHRTRSS